MAIGDENELTDPAGFFLKPTYPRHRQYEALRAYYVGGRSTVDGVTNDDRQSNTRIGATFALPVGRRHSIKLAVSRGAIVRVGADFSTFSFGWQTAWVTRPAPAR